MDMSSLAIRVSRTPGLAMLPQITHQVLRLVDNPNASPRHMTALIERDTGLAAKLLRVANSANYGMSGKVRTLIQAVNLLGLTSVRSIAIGQAYQQLITQKGHAARFNRAAFWQHSLAVATAARLLARLKGVKDPEEAFMVGLIHDAGKLVLERFVPGEFDQALLLASDSHIALYEAEKEVFGYSHVETGVLLAKQWNLPKNFQEAIEFHHEPVFYQEKPLACLLYHANLLAHEAGFFVGSTTPPSFGPDVQESLELSSESLDQLKQVFAEEVKRTGDALRV
ncbi:MAG: HDOD domain-containing protein [Fimbriimonadia bacterium]|nr:HDOD domain-containing protein [Fimbriimonadia bacterium]